MCYHALMKNITLAIDETLLAAARDYAAQRNTSLNQLVRDLLDQTVIQNRKAAAKEMLRHMQENSGNSRGWKWNREEAHERGL